MVSLLQLQYAISVEKHRHFGKAADACFVTQPTLSQQLQKLEEEIGIVLFDRTKKPILPTLEGQKFLNQAKVVAREHEKLIHISKQKQDGIVSGDFKLAVIPTVSSYLLPYLIQPFAKSFPKVRLFIEEMKTETILQELEEDRLDGAILATPIEQNEFKIYPLYYEPFLIYFSPGHPLLKNNHIERSQLSSKELWLLEDGHCFKDQVLNFCSIAENEASPFANVRFRSGSLDTLRRLVQQAKGYTLIPALMAMAMRKDEQTAHVRPFKSPIPTREISLIYRRDHWKLDIIKGIEKTVIESLPTGLSRTAHRRF